MKTITFRIIYGTTWVITIGTIVFGLKAFNAGKSSIFFLVGICALLYLLSGFVMRHSDPVIRWSDLLKYFKSEKFVTIGSLALAIYFFYVAFTE